MRRILQLSALGLVAGVMSACTTPDQVVATPDIPTAGLRFIHAAPDVGPVDFRPVDLVEDGHFQIGFRNNPVTASNAIGATTVEYKNYRAGTRYFHMFNDGGTAAVASSCVSLVANQTAAAANCASGLTSGGDSVFALTAGHVYSVILWGTGAGHKMTLIDETVADPGANVSIRVLNATNAAQDFRVVSGAAAEPAAPDFAAVLSLTASGYVSKAPAAIRVTNRPAGAAAGGFPGGGGTVTITGTHTTTAAGVAAAAPAGTATFSVTQQGFISAGTIITISGTNYTVASFNGTTGAVITGAPDNTNPTCSVVPVPPAVVICTPVAQTFTLANPVDATGLQGNAATVDIEGTPGTTVAGSAVTMLLYPPTVAGTGAASFTLTGPAYIWDRRPPRPSTT